jgi:hypothetical protein
LAWADDSCCLTLPRSGEINGCARPSAGNLVERIVLSQPFRLIQLTFVVRSGKVRHSPTTVFPGAATEAYIAVPTKRTNAQIRSDGSCGLLQVGTVMVIGDGIRVTDPRMGYQV